MSAWRKKAFKKLIDHAAEVMSRRICSDTPGEIIDAIPEGKRLRLARRYEQYNSDGKDFEGFDNVTGQDWLLLYALWLETENEIEQLKKKAGLL